MSISTPTPAIWVFLLIELRRNPYPRAAKFLAGKYFGDSSGFGNCGRSRIQSHRSRIPAATVHCSELRRSRGKDPEEAATGGAGFGCRSEVRHWSLKKEAQRNHRRSLILGTTRHLQRFL
ncbi:hypothetical protein U1Q18_033011 [Sarracenia purpurea var. burkii]